MSEPEAPLVRVTGDTEGCGVTLAAFALVAIAFNTCTIAGNVAALSDRLPPPAVADTLAPRVP